MGILETIKEVARIAKRVGDIELTNTIIELQGQLLDMQDTMVNLRQENETLKKENEDLKNQLETSKDVMLYKGFAYNKKDKLNRGPFCLACWNQRKTLNPVNKVSAVHMCSACHAIFDYVPWDDEIDKILAKEQTNGV